MLSRIKEAIAVYGFTAADLGVDKGAGRGAPVAKQRAQKSQKGKKQAAEPTPPKKNSGMIKATSGAAGALVPLGSRPRWRRGRLQTIYLPSSCGFGSFGDMCLAAPLFESHA